MYAMRHLWSLAVFDCGVVRMTEEHAIRRLFAWGGVCPGEPAMHRAIGEAMLKDFAWADDVAVGV